MRYLDVNSAVPHCVLLFWCTDEVYKKKKGRPKDRAIKALSHSILSSAFQLVFAVLVGIWKIPD